MRRGTNDRYTRADNLRQLERAAADLRALRRDIRQIGIAGRALAKLNRAQKSLDGAVRHAAGLHTRAVMVAEEERPCPK